MNKLVKKILIMAMVLVMSVSAAAMAEIITESSIYTGEEIETVLWTAEDASISFEVPADWIEFDAEFITGLIQDMVANGQLEEAGANEYVQQLMAQSEVYFAFFYMPDLVNCVNITTADAGGFDMVAMFDQLKPVLEQQFAQAGFEVSSILPVTIGAHNAIETQINYMGVDQTQYLVMSPDLSTSYTFTFAGDARDYIDTIMGTLVFGAAE